MPQIKEIGKHCFSESALTKIIVGKNVSSIGYQTKLSNPVVYGYASTVAKTFAEDNSCQFVDLTLRIAEDLPSRRVIKQSEGLEVRLKYFGLETTSKITFSGASNQIVYAENAISDFEKELVINLQNLAAITTCQLKVEIKDYYSQTVVSSVLNVVIVENSRNAYAIDFGEGDYEVFVDGELASENTLLYENIQYTINVNAEDGYALEKLWLNGVEYSPNSTATISVEKDLQVSVETDELVVLQIDFVVGQGGAVKVDGQEVSSATIQRYGSLTFTVVENVGYSVAAIKIDGVDLKLSEDSVYTIGNVSKNKTIEVVFEEAYYVVKVLLGKGGNLSPAELESSVAKGDSKTFYISMIEGYELEYVSINGVVIECDGHTFTIDNIEEDCEVYISLQKQTDLFGSEFSNIIRYFLVFLGLFFVFIVARILLHYARKEKNKVDKNRYLKK